MRLSFYILLGLNISVFILQWIWGSDLPSSFEIGFAAVLIALFGIPHGAIDHKLFLKSTSHNATFFYTFYLTLILIYVLMWIYLPLVSMLLFLFISTYHFGQSQLQYLKGVSPNIKKILYFFWGSIVLSSLIILKYNELMEIMIESGDLLALKDILLFHYFQFLFVSSLFGFLFILLIHRHQINLNWLLKEVLYLTLIFLTFSTQPVLIGFSLYFVASHSFDVMVTEYKFLKRTKQKLSIKNFVLELMPFSILSILGTTFLIVSIKYEWISISYPFLFFIVIASLTLPHSLVMEVFYRKLRDSKT